MGESSFIPVRIPWLVLLDHVQFEETRWLSTSSSSPWSARIICFHDDDDDDNDDDDDDDISSSSSSSILLCVICVFPRHQPLRLLLLKGGHGIFNVRNDLRACCTHESETGTNESAQVLTRRN